MPIIPTESKAENVYRFLSKTRVMIWNLKNDEDSKNSYSAAWRNQTLCAIPLSIKHTHETLSKYQSNIAEYR